MTRMPQTRCGTSSSRRSEQADSSANTVAAYQFRRPATVHALRNPSAILSRTDSGDTPWPFGRTERRVFGSCPAGLNSGVRLCCRQLEASSLVPHMVTLTIYAATITRLSVVPQYDPTASKKEGAIA